MEYPREVAAVHPALAPLVARPHIATPNGMLPQVLCVPVCVHVCVCVCMCLCVGVGVELRRRGRFDR